MYVSFALLLLLAHYAGSIPSLKVLQNAYVDFAVKYGRVHADEAEAKMRFDVFLQSMQKIEELNKRNDGAVYGITKFADWTQEERSKLLMKNTPMPKNAEKLPERLLKSSNAPAAWDWRGKGILTSIKNQGKCGSCYAFATMAVVESMYAIKTGQLVDLSEQQLVDCTPNEYGGCNGAEPYDTFMLLRQRGALLESEHPYKGIEMTCPAKNGKIFVEKVYNITGVDEMEKAIAFHAPIQITFKCPDSIFQYVSGIYTPTILECVTTLVGHVVEVVGYGTENQKDYWIIKNSWGPTFGDNGYFKLAKGTNVCGSEAMSHGADIL